MATDNEPKVIELNEGTDTISLKGTVSNDTYVEIKFPFNVNKIPPDFRNTTNVLENVLVLRNNFFTEYDICEVRKASKARLGYIFKPNIIFEEDSAFIYEDDLHLRIAIFRAFVVLLSNNSTLKYSPMKSTRDVDYQFEDFFPSDIIVGVFPFSMNPDFEEVKTKLYLNLYLHGFYVLNKLSDLDAVLPNIDYQRLKFESLIFQRNTYRKYLDIKEISKNVNQNKYCFHYLNDIVKSQTDEISKFHHIYGLVEVFKDLVLKQEIIQKLNLASNEDVSGYKLHTDIVEISRDSHSVSKLFSKYSGDNTTLTDDMFLKLIYFLEDCRKKEELKDLKSFPQTYYFLRNIIVHDIQFLFTQEDSTQHREKLSELVYQIEFLIFSTLLALKI